MDALVHAIEINDRHGVGILIRRLFGAGDDFAVFRSRTLYADGSQFGAREIDLSDRIASLGELRARLRDEGRRAQIQRILCVPYYPEDFRNAVILKRETGARLCTWLMDDQNVFSHEAGDFAVSRLIERSDLCFGISPQMALAYERKFGRRVFWLPPVVRTRPAPPARGEPAAGRAALIGNVWSPGHLDNLRRVIRESGWKIDWFGRGPDAGWLRCDPAALAGDGISLPGHLDDDALCEALRRYPFAIVPVGTLDEADDRMSLSALSLPSRIIYLLTQAGIPVLVLGSGRGAAAAFVRETGTGLTAGYSAAEFVEAARALAAPSFANAVESTAQRMVLAEGGEWIWRSLDAGRPADDRFERLRTGALDDLPLPVAPRSRRASRTPLLSVLRRRAGRASAEDAQWLRFSRRAHLPWIRRVSPLDAEGPHSFEPGDYQRALAVALVRRLVQPGALVRVLAGDRTPNLKRIARTHRIEVTPWREAAGAPAADADAVLSFQQPFGRAADLRLTDWLDGFGEAGALQLHCWTAYQTPGHFSAPDAAMALLGELDDSSRVAEEILDDSDFLFMSGQALARYWPARNAMPGRPFSLNLTWRTRR